MRTLILLAGFVLAGCAAHDADNMQAMQAQWAQIDNARCHDLGFTTGTEAYGNCRLKLMGIRAQMMSGAAAAQGAYAAQQGANQQTYWSIYNASRYRPQ